MRSHTHRLALAGAVLGVLAAGALAPAAAATAKHKPAKPAVHKLSATTGPTKGGTKVTVTGTGFSHVTKVEFGTAKARSLKVSSSKKLRVIAPKHSAGKVTVTIVAKAGKSAKTKHTSFTYVAPPTVAHLLPASGTTNGGSTVTVAGKNFTHVTKVVFGSTTAKSVKVTSTKSLTVTEPKHALGTVDLRVTTAYGISPNTAADHFAYVAAPAPLTFVNKTVPQPLGANVSQVTELYDVSCGAVGSCVALGDYNTGHGFFVSVLSAGTWSDGISPTPSDVMSSHIGVLDDISCASATSCVAVGQYFDSTAHVQAEIATYDGSSWTAEKAPLPGAAPGSSDSTTNLTHVVCTSSTSCVAVGVYRTTSNGIQGFIDTLAGGTWTAAVAPLPSDKLTTASQAVTITGLACPAAGSCAAIGTYTRSNDYRDVLGLALSGGTWKAAAPVTPNDTTSEFGAETFTIACSAPGACAAVADASNEGLEVVLKSGAWKVAITPGTSTTPHSSSALTQVGCLAGGSCVGAGTGGDATDGAVLVRIGGPAINAPVPSNGKLQGAETNQLTTVGCTTTLCLAGGDYWSGTSDDQPLLDQYDGNSWVAVTAPLPDKSLGGPIEATACAGPTFCVVTGFSITGSNQAVALADIGTP